MREDPSLDIKGQELIGQLPELLEGTWQLLYKDRGQARLGLLPLVEDC
jgi:hypothetical protein